MLDASTQGECAVANGNDNDNNNNNNDNNNNNNNNNNNDNNNVDIDASPPLVEEKPNNEKILCEDQEDCQPCYQDNKHNSNNNNNHKDDGSPGDDNNEEEGLTLEVGMPKTDGGSYETGLRLWTGGLLLAGFLAERGAELIRGKTVLELGAGISALPTAVAGRMNAKLAVATDYLPEIVDIAEENLEQMEEIRRRRKTAAAILDWCYPDSSPALGMAEKWDLIMFADSIYTEDIGTLLAECLDTLVPSGSSTTIIGALSEIRVGTIEFVRSMQARGFRARELELEASSRLKESIDDCSVVVSPSSSEERERLVHGRPIEGSKVVQWTRPDPQKLQKQSENEAGGTDEGDRLWRYFAESLAEKERNVKMAEGFEIWE